MRQRERSKDEIPFKEMTPAQKRSYLWDYWRIPVLVVVVIAVASILLIRTIVTAKDTLFAVTMVDCGEENAFEPYAEQFAQEQGIPLDQMTFGNVVVGSASSQSGMALYVHLQFGTEDILVLPESVFMEYAVSGYFLDLTDAVPQEWQDKLVMADQRYDEYDDVQPEPMACGIHVRDIPGMPQTQYYQDAVIAISYNPGNYDTAVAFLNSLLKK